MSTKKIPSPTEGLPGPAQPRFKKIVIIDTSDVDLFINEALLSEIITSKSVSRENSPSNLIIQLKNINLLSEVPELIILDAKMDRVEGFSFLEEFRKLSDFIRDRCKIVIVSTSDDPDEKLRILMNPNVIRYLTKPIDAFQLKDIIYS